MSVDDTANVLHRVANGTVGERLAGNCLVTAEDKNNDGAVRVSWRVHVNQCRAEKLLEPRTREREREIRSPRLLFATKEDESRATAG